MFTFKEISENNIDFELASIGFDLAYLQHIKQKVSKNNIKIFGLSSAQANILKQTALSLGTDCAVNRDVITGKAESSNAILFATDSQLEKIADKLSSQPFSLKILAKELLDYLNFTPQKTKIVGILNLSENSFSGDFVSDTASALSKIHQLFNEGADIVDIGAESTKPYSAPVHPDAQLDKLLPLLKEIKSDTSLNNKLFSIDTRSALVAEKCINLLQNNIIINDVSGFDFDTDMPKVISKFNTPIVIQHSKGNPLNMQDNPHYDNVIEEIFFDLKSKIDFAHSLGITNIIIDMGIGFGKTKEDNLQIIHRVKEFRSLNCPIMLGISRKSFLDADSNEERDLFTLALNSLAFQNNIDYIRVHNVKIHKKLSSFFN